MIQLVTDIFLVFFKIGAFTFGGGYAMLPLMERDIIEIKQWLSTSEFLDILAISQMTPGPIAINCSTFVGFKVGGFWGSLAGTVGVIIVSVILSGIIARYFFMFKDNRVLKAMFKGIRPAVVVLLASAVLSTGSAALIDIKAVLICIILFISLIKFKLNPILGIVLSGTAGILLY